VLSPKRGSSGSFRGLLSLGKLDVAQAQELNAHKSRVQGTCQLGLSAAMVWIRSLSTCLDIKNQFHALQLNLTLSDADR